MPTLQQNLTAWTDSSQWKDQGEEWSHAWGGSEAQWFGCILPRIHSFLPVPTILEIAPGFGRWTNYLKNYCEQLIIVDLAENCIEACKQRFAPATNISYYVNDGRSLDMIDDNSIDFIFSFDSLVHADSGVMQSYISQFARKLRPAGFGFIHHSNIGEYSEAFFRKRGVPKPIKQFLLARGILDNSHGRDFSMTAKLFGLYCKESHLQCTSQEQINWGARRLIDSFSVFKREASAKACSNLVIKNPDFMKEAHQIKKISGIYSSVNLKR